MISEKNVEKCNKYKSRKEMQSLIDSSRKSLAEAELQIAERNKLIKNEIAEKEQVQPSQQN